MCKQYLGFLDQTFKDFELILVDDGSTDASGEICDEYSINYFNVKVIHKENSGISSARNVGIALSTGKWLMFCDDDDKVEPGWMETLYDAAQMHRNCLINCEFAKVDTNGNKMIIKIPDIKEEQSFERDDYYLLYKYNYSPYLWIRIFDATIIKKYRIAFNESMKKGGEDALFVLDYFKHIDGRILYVPKCHYLWIDNGSSTSRNYNPFYYDLVKVLYWARKEFISKQYMQEYKNTYFYIFYHCIINVMAKNPQEHSEKIKYCNQIIKDAAFQDALSGADSINCDDRLRRVLSFKNMRILEIYWKMIDVLHGK